MDGNGKLFLKATVGVYTMHGYTLPYKQCMSIYIVVNDKLVVKKEL